MPTYRGWDGINHLHVAYGIPYAAGGLTLALYLVLRQARPNQEDSIGRVFAASAIVTYYWFRLPPMFGIGDADAAMLVDISPWLPSWSATTLRMFAFIAFGWLMVVRTGKRRAWEIHPPTAENPNVHASPKRMGI